MLLLMKRSQMTKHGHLLMGVAYKFEGEKYQETAANLLAKKFAEKTTMKKVATAAKKTADRQNAQIADQGAKGSGGLRPVLGYAEDAVVAQAELGALTKAAKAAAAEHAKAQKTAKREGATDADIAAENSALEAAQDAEIAVDRAAKIVGAFGDLLAAFDDGSQKSDGE